MIQGKLLAYGDDLTEINIILREVFHLDEESNRSINKIEDEFTTYVVVYEGINNRKTVAMGSMYYDGIKCRIKKVAVLDKYRRKKYGDFAVRMLINRAFTSGITKVYVYSPTEFIKFFESIGFKASDLNKNDNNEIEMVISNMDLVFHCNK